MKITIKKFGQSLTEYINNYPAKEQSYSFWYEDTLGNRVKCEEGFVESLWSVWISRADSTRDDDDKFSIFVFGEPYETIPR